MTDIENYHTYYRNVIYNYINENIKEIADADTLIESNKKLFHKKEYIKNINKLDYFAGELELYAASKLLKINIIVFELNKDNRYRFLYKYSYEEKELIYTMILEHCYLKSNAEHFQLLYINRFNFKIGKDHINNKEYKYIKNSNVKEFNNDKCNEFLEKKINQTSHNKYKIENTDIQNNLTEKNLLQKLNSLFDEFNDKLKNIFIDVINNKLRTDNSNLNNNANQIANNNISNLNNIQHYEDHEFVKNSNNSLNSIDSLDSNIEKKNLIVLYQ